MEKRQRSFPLFENVAPLVAEAYIWDHHGLDAAFEELNASYGAHDPLKTARATAAFRFHLGIHLDKEDAHLYRIFRERIPMPEQGKAVGIMASLVPKERFPGTGSVGISLNRERRSREHDPCLPDGDASPCLSRCKRTHQKVHWQ